MNNLRARTISGIVLIVIIVGTIILSKYSMLSLILVIFSLSMLEFRKMFLLKDRLLLLLSLLAGQIFIILNFFQFSKGLPVETYPVLVLLILTSMVLYYIFFKNTSIKNIGWMLFSGLWIAVSLSFYMGLAWIESPDRFNPRLMIILITLIWINDVSAYFFGSIIGKNPLAPAISPGKTWEGFLAGILTNAIAGFVIYQIAEIYTAYFWIIVAIIVSLGATAGDLFESKIKREANVKDSGTMIPGHGGILDRFDSLLFCAPLFYLFIIIWGKI